MRVQESHDFSEEEQMRLRASMLRIIPMSDRIAERFHALFREAEHGEGNSMSDFQRDRLMVFLATLVDQACMPAQFKVTCRKLAAEDFGMSSGFLFGSSGERALRKALAEVAWNLIEPDEIDLWVKLQRLAARAHFDQAKYAIAEFGSPSKEMGGSSKPRSRSTRAR